MAEQILIEFVGDVTKLQPAIDLLQKTGQISEKDAAAFKKLNAESTKAFAGVNKSGKESLKTLKDVEKGVNSLSDAIEEGIAEGMQDALDEAGVSVEEFAAALKDAGVDVEGLAKQTEKLDSAEASLKKRLKEIKAELSLMKAESRDNTEEYARLRAEAGQLDDAIKDVNEEISRSGSDTRGLDNLIQLAGGVAGGFAIAQGSMALFGDESEEVQKTLLKVNAAMAVLQGLQQIQDILSKKNFQSLAALVGMKQVETIQTNLQTAAESKNIIVKYAAIAAQKALNVVLALNPLGAVLALVTAVAAAWAVFGANTRAATQELNRLNNALLSSEEGLENTLRGIDRANERIVANAKERGRSTNEIIRLEGEAGNRRLAAIHAEIRALALAQTAAKVTTEEQAEAYKKLGDRKLELEKQLQDETLNLELKASDFRRKQYEDSVKSYAAFVDAKVLLAQKGSIDEIDAQIASVKAQADAQRKLNPDLTPGEEAKLTAETNRQIIELNEQRNIKLLENERALVEAKLAVTREGSVEELEQQKKVAEINNDIALQSIELTNEKRKALIAEGAREQRDFERRIVVQRLNDAQTEINTRIALSKIGSEAEFSAKLDLLNNQEKIELTNAQDNAKKRLEIEATFQKQRAELANAFDAQVQTEVLNTRAAETNKRIAELTKASTSETNKELLDLKKQAVEEQAQLDIISARTSITNEQERAAKIKEIRAKANADKLAIDQAAAIAEINFQVEITNTIIDLEKKRLEAQANRVGFNFRAQRQAVNQLKALTNEQINNEEKALEDKRKRGLINEEDYQRQLLALQGRRIDQELAAEEKKEQLKRELISTGFQILNEAVSTFFDIQSDKRQADLDNSLAALQTQREKELDNKNQTEAEKANIDARYRAKENALKRRAFEADKAAKRQQAIIAGALAVVQAFAQLGPVAGAIAAVAIAASTLLQISKINSAQPPAFAKGTKKAPKGLKRVGEKGPELSYKKGDGWKWLGLQGEEIIWSKGGEQIFPYKKSMEIAESWKGGSVARTDKAIRKSMPGSNKAIMSNISVTNSGNMVFDYEKMAEAMADKIKIPAEKSIYNNISEEGITTMVVENGNKMIVRNSRYKMNK